jgi:hypothetical protein
MKASGKCLCGAVSFLVEEVSPQVHACHCSMCRNWCGGPGLAVKVGRIEFTGEEHIGRYDSSAWADRGFCRRCGTSLFYRLKEANQYFVWQGTFNDQTPFRLTGEIYVDEKPSGYEFAGAHPRLTAAEFLASLQKS